MEKLTNDWFKETLNTLAKDYNISDYWAKSKSSIDDLVYGKYIPNDKFRDAIFDKANGAIQKLKDLGDRADETTIREIWNSITSPLGNKLGEMPTGIDWHDAVQELWKFYRKEADNYWYETTGNISDSALKLITDMTIDPKLAISDDTVKAIKSSPAFERMILEPPEHTLR